MARQIPYRVQSEEYLESEGERSLRIIRERQISMELAQLRGDEAGTRARYVPRHGFHSRSVGESCLGDEPGGLG